MAEPDVGWHIKAGEVILNSHIPQHDVWSYVGQEQEWYNISWMWDIMNFVLYQFIGLNGLHTLSSILFATLMVLIFHKLQKERKGFSSDLINITTTLVGLVLWSLTYFRPQLGAYFIMFAFLNTLEKFIFTNKVQIKPLSKLIPAINSVFLILPVLTIIWANIHGSFILSFIILGIHIVSAGYKKHYTIFKQLLIILIFCFLATLINPLGYKIYYGVLRTLDSAITEYIAEWRPFTFGIYYGMSLLVLVLLMLSFIPKIRKVHITLEHKILFAITLLAALSSIRNFGVFVVLNAGTLMKVIHQSFYESKLQYKFSNKLLGAINIILFILASYTSAIIDKSGLESIPVSEIEFLRKNCVKCKVFNEYEMGGYLMLLGDQKFKHFIDGRAGTVFTEEVINSYLKYLQGKTTIIALISKYPADAMIILKSQELPQDMKHSWKTVYQGEKYKVLFKNSTL